MTEAPEGAPPGSGGPVVGRLKGKGSGWRVGTATQAVAAAARESREAGSVSSQQGLCSGTGQCLGEAVWLQLRGEDSRPGQAQRQGQV